MELPVCILRLRYCRSKNEFINNARWTVWGGRNVITAGREVFFCACVCSSLICRRQYEEIFKETQKLFNCSVATLYCLGIIKGTRTPCLYFDTLRKFLILFLPKEDIYSPFIFAPKLMQFLGFNPASIEVSGKFLMDFTGIQWLFIHLFLVRLGHYKYILHS